MHKKTTSQQRPRGRFAGTTTGRIIHGRLALIAAGWVAAFASASTATAGKSWVIGDLYPVAPGAATESPFAIGHRGSGVNTGEDPDRPIENTRDSVRQAFRDGVSMVEVDVQITSDGQVVAFHDDFLADFRCVNSLTYKQLKRELGEVSLLKKILNTARSYRHRRGGPTGLVIVELKAPAPLCDPDDSTAVAYVSAVVDVIRERKMEGQVVLQSFSPTLLQIAAECAPEIDRQLALSILQLLSVEEVAAVTGLPVTVIDKNDFGLQWAEIGVLFRLPGYDSIPQFLGVSLALGARAVVLDAFILVQAELGTSGSGAVLVDTFQLFGLPVLTYTLNTEEDWIFAESLGVDGIITDNIPLGLELQSN